MDSNNVHVINSEENVISLGGIFDFLLKKWKTIIVVCVIGLVVGVGLAFMPEKSDYEMKNIDENKVNILHEYQILLNNKLLEQQNNVIANFDPDNTYIGELNLYIEASTNEIGIINNEYLMLAVNEELYGEINKVQGNKYDYYDLRELVNIYSVKEQDNAEKIIKSDDYNNALQNAVITLSIKCDDYNKCKEILEIFKTYSSEVENDLVKLYPSFAVKTSMEKITKSMYVVETKRQSLLKETEDLNTKVANLKTGLNSDETNYSKELYPDDWKIKKEKTLMSYLKMPVLMTFLAAFLICFIYVMKYIFNHQIKTASELDDMFGLHVFGVYKASENKKGFDGVLQRREAKKDLVENSKEYIVNSVKELNKNPIILVGNKNNNVISSFMDDLKNLSGDLSSYGELQSDPEAISVAHKQNGIILVINLWNTTADEINREIEIAIAQNINVLGCIVVK